MAGCVCARVRGVLLCVVRWAFVCADSVRPSRSVRRTRRRERQSAAGRRRAAGGRRRAALRCKLARCVDTKRCDETFDDTCTLD
eukprot:6213751-Pleurochrysis_carterae.AAC.1